MRNTKNECRKNAAICSPEKEMKEVATIVLQQIDKKKYVRLRTGMDLTRVLKQTAHLNIVWITNASKEGYVTSM